MGVAKAYPVACLIVGSRYFRCLSSLLFSSFKWCRLQDKSQETSTCLRSWTLAQMADATDGGCSACAWAEGSPSWHFPAFAVQCRSRFGCCPTENQEKQHWSMLVVSCQRHVEGRRLGRREKGGTHGCESSERQKEREIGVTRDLHE